MAVKYFILMRLITISLSVLIVLGCELNTKVREPKIRFNTEYNVLELANIHNELEDLAKRNNLDFWFNEYETTKKDGRSTTRLFVLTGKNVYQGLEVKIITGYFPGIRVISEIGVAVYFENESLQDIAKSLAREIRNIMADSLKKYQTGSE